MAARRACWWARCQPEGVSLVLHGHWHASGLPHVPHPLQHLLRLPGTPRHRALTAPRTVKAPPCTANSQSIATIKLTPPIWICIKLIGGTLMGPTLYVVCTTIEPLVLFMHAHSLRRPWQNGAECSTQERITLSHDSHQLCKLGVTVAPADCASQQEQHHQQHQGPR